jgi:hypothetical protein
VRVIYEDWSESESESEQLRRPGGDGGCSESESESEQLRRPGRVPGSDSLDAKGDAIEEGEDKRELVLCVGVTGLAADSVFVHSFAVGGVTGRELMVGWMI